MRPAPARPAHPLRRRPRRRTASVSRALAVIACAAEYTIRALRFRCSPHTKLMPAEEDPAAMDGRDSGSPQQFCLRWNNYQNNLTSCFDQLLQSQSFVDVTLACEGQSLKAHKVVLSACSPYFQSLLMENPCRHPIIIIRDVKYCDLKAAVDFMYRGEINVSQDQIAALLKVADTLKIRGLTDVSGEHASLAGYGAGSERSRGSKRAASPGGESASARACRRASEERGGSGSCGSRTHASPGASPPADLLPPPEPHAAAPAGATAGAQPMHDDIDIRPGIAEMIREEERVSPYLFHFLRSAEFTFVYNDNSPLYRSDWGLICALVKVFPRGVRHPLKTFHSVSNNAFILDSPLY